MFRARGTFAALLVSSTLHAATVDLRIMETTDLHSSMMDFDYYQDRPTDKYGLVHTASLLVSARQQATNSVWSIMVMSYRAARWGIIWRRKD